MDVSEWKLPSDVQLVDESFLEPGNIAPIIDLVSEESDNDTPILTLVSDESDHDMSIPISQQPLTSTVRDSTPVSITSTAVSGEAVELPFDIIDETSKTFSKFNTTGRSLLIKLKPPTADQEPTAYRRECITSLTNYLVEIPDKRFGRTQNPKY